AANSGRTIYDVAISNSIIAQLQARFDPVFEQKNRLDHVEQPQGLGPDPFGLLNYIGFTTDQFRSDATLRKTNVLGGDWSINWSENPRRSEFFPPRFDSLFINPVNTSSLEAAFNQPLLQGGGYLFNMAPIVIARIDTERSFFQYKDSVQELVKGVIEAYWNLVLARVQEWAQQIKVDQAEEASRREEARQKAGLAALSDVAQAKTTLYQFKANLIAAKANVLAREGALRNILGLPPGDNQVIIPVSAPTDKRLRPIWDELMKLAEQKRPDIIELKLVLEAEQVRLYQAKNLYLPQLNLNSFYRWNGFKGELANDRKVETDAGQFTDWSVSVNFAVPLGLREARAKIRQQSLLIARDRANLEQAMHQTFHALAIAMRDLDNSYEQYNAFKDTRAAALDNLKVQIEQFNANRTIYLNVLQALNDWGNAVNSEASQLVSYNIALANLERLTGTILETHGLVFAEERYKSAGPLGVLGHGRLYPGKMPVEGEPARYPGIGEPGENAFDLKKPDLKGSRGKDEFWDKLPGLPSEEQQLPTPRVVPEKDTPTNLPGTSGGQLQTLPALK
ncbi:MAG: TolC family protein, partial [Gemmataceae bacterium]